MSELTIIKCVVCEAVIDHAETFCYKCGVALRSPHTKTVQNSI